MWTGDKAFQAAVVRALKKAGSDALRLMRAESKRQIRKTRAIKAGFLTDAFPLTYSKGNSISDLGWRMDVSGKAVPLGQYPVRQTKKGVSVEVVRGVRKLIRGAFLATATKSEDGRAGVFLRPGKARYPMGHRLGPTVSDNMRQRGLITAVYVAVQNRFAATFNRVLPGELAKSKKQG